MTDDEREHLNCVIRQCQAEFDEELTFMAAYVDAIRAGAAKHVCRWVELAKADATARNPQHVQHMGDAEIADFNQQVEHFLGTVPKALDDMLQQPRHWAHLDGTLRTDLPAGKLPPRDRYGLMTSPPKELAGIFARVMAPLGKIMIDTGFKPPEGFTWLVADPNTNEQIWVGRTDGSNEFMNALGGYARHYGRAIEKIDRIQKARATLDLEAAMKRMGLG